jgi:hypothetical protein
MTETQKPEKPKEPEKMLFSWKASSRPFKKRAKEFWLRTIAVASVLGLVLFIIEGAMPVILLIAVFFLFYILSTVEPETIEYKITSYGVRVAENLNDWNFFTRFWFTERLGSNLIVFETTGLTGRLELIIDLKDREKLKTEVSKYIQEEKATPTSIDRASEWISERFVER